MKAPGRRGKAELAVGGRRAPRAGRCRRAGSLVGGGGRRASGARVCLLRVGFRWEYLRSAEKERWLQAVVGQTGAAGRWVAVSAVGPWDAEPGRARCRLLVLAPRRPRRLQPGAKAGPGRSWLLAGPPAPVRGLAKPGANQGGQ